MVAPRQETTTGAAGASEPLCIAQGAAANVPKFPRRHPQHYTHPVPLHLPPTSCTRRLLHLQTPPQLRTTFNAPTPRCLLYDYPQDHLSPRHTRPHCCPPRLHEAIEPPANRSQALKTRRKKNVKKGIQFCLMVCGASGTGRTTFVNTLCGKKVLEHKESDDPTVAHVEEGVKIQPITVGMSPQ
jgi:hypothetical protein